MYLFANAQRNRFQTLIGRSLSREVLKVLAVGDNACETSL